MFTGIIQTLGTITATEKRGGDVRLQISTAGINDEIVELGDSIACNGVCLTVVHMQNSGDQREFTFDVSNESIAKSLIGQWQQGTQVNMELAMLPTTRFGGHIVSGHVDGLGEVLRMEEDGRSWRIWFRSQAELAKYIASKGSITIDGISLTVNGVEGTDFHVNIVPHTMEVTTLGQRKVGDKVHLEIDVIARYLEQLLRSNKENNSKNLIKKLSENGFLD